MPRHLSTATKNSVMQTRPSRTSGLTCGAAWVAEARRLRGYQSGRCGLCAEKTRSDAGSKAMGPRRIAADAI